MVAKVLGLASGALVASLGVWGFNAWRHVSDEDRLASVISEHCIPYVQTGVTPFDGMGRSVGVYDSVELDARVTGGGAVVIFDGRFVASWGEIADPALRICRVDSRQNGTSSSGFFVELDGFTARYTDFMQPLGDMQTDVDRLGGDIVADGVYQTIAWFEADKPQDRGNRVVMSVSQSQVSNVIVVRDLAPSP